MKKIKTLLFYYDDFSNFEVACTAFQFHDGLITAALEQRPFKSEENMVMIPHKTLDEINPAEIDLFVIPGGNPTSLFENATLRSFLTAVADRGGVVAGICGGTGLMAAMGLLKGKKCTGNSAGIGPDWKWGYPLFSESIITNESAVVVDGNMVTSQGRAFLEMSLRLNDVMGMYSSEEERQQDLDWWMGGN
ncbi:DJ-1/PfpI family protein [Spirochaeta isovalerica]|uniref:4-methyl-5(B-hydroxyethyl)-thiazole monophosphate biosynthesis n=1 Tax=Spirochaeta isovalerica TaxID=150 RepID=A0A841RAL2_9SPIO|nr:DJ-1/PfpI family protein [Spirochaeta isovalerica]MBB6480975.1 4-methyl-5(b-hydroxyethyl)-thiazole monophosphate biosynthesis [Spirochaeta isovalerica]